MKALIVIFCIIHFFLIILSSAFQTINSFREIHDYPAVRSPMVESILLNKFFGNYAILSGINTGYGFYGINIATEKFFIVDIYDSNFKKIDSISTFNLVTKNSLNRFQVLPSTMANYISETEDLKKKNKTSKIELTFREDYVLKIFKYIGLHAIRDVPNRKYFSVKLYGLTPVNIWNQKKSDDKKVAYLYKEILFDQRRPQ